MKSKSWCLSKSNSLPLIGMLAAIALTGCGLGAGKSGQSSLQPTDPPPCDVLDEAACIAQQSCAPNYVESSCVCAACEPGAECPPCDCTEPTRQFIGCEAVDPCAGLSEDACIGEQACAPQYGLRPCPAIACEPGDERCPRCDSEETYIGCETEPPACLPVACDLWCEYGFAEGPDGCPICACNPPPCEDLGEDACRQTPYCEPIYGDPTDPPGCVCDACVPGVACPPCECPVDPAPGYQGCRPAPPICPPVCEIACQYGNVLDENGCPTCACNPPPDNCTELSEAACIDNPSCEPTYVGYVCACPDCRPGEPCEPCDCEQPRYEYAGCVARGPCDDLSEERCISNPSCEPSYGTVGCRCDACVPGDMCEPCECPDEPAHEYLGCYPTPPVCAEVLCDLYCEYGYALDDYGCQTCACNPPPPCPDILCDVYCEYGHVIDDNGCQTCTCLPPPGPGCEELPEERCIDADECRPWYEGEGCACDACVPGVACPPCTCPDEPELRYGGCEPA